MYLYLSKILNKSFIINFLFSSLIISFIVGNLALNIVVLSLIIASIAFYGKKIIKIDIDSIDKIVIILFLYILLCGFINNIYYRADGLTDDFTILIKSILFLRFLIFYFVIKFLIKENIINFKIFFITAFGAVLFVCLDIFYQYIFGYDIFGFKGTVRRLSGPFGDENIAGSFIQRFSLFSLFLLPIFFKIKNNSIQYLIITILACLLLAGLVLAGNRIPILFFLVTLIGLVIFEKNLRKFFIPFVLIAASFFYSISVPIDVSPLSKNMYYHLTSFKTKAFQIFDILSPENILTKEEEAKSSPEEDILFYTFEYKDKKYKLTNTHLKEFNFGIISWKKNKYFGGGLKSSGIICEKYGFLNCSNHPHNYYLEILSTLGLAGFFITLILLSLVFYKTFITKYFRISNLNNYQLITPFIFLFFSEIFPIKSTGSFFTTGNATYIFLLFSIMVSLLKIKKLD